MGHTDRGGGGDPSCRGGARDNSGVFCARTGGRCCRAPHHLHRQLSSGAESEAENEARIKDLFSDLGVAVDVKNEARVHLWYPAKFGHPIAPYGSAEEAIATFPTTSTAVGVRPRGSQLDICAPFGLDDLLGLVVRPNKAQITRAIYEAKVARWRLCWPNLKICDWEIH